MTPTEGPRARGWVTHARACVAVVVIAFMTPAVGWADARRDAKRHFQAGMELVRRGQTDKGVGELERAYRLKPHPNVLFNIARAYDLAGRTAEAITAYERYLAAEPPDTREADARLAVLRATRAAPSPAPPEPTPPPMVAAPVSPPTAMSPTATTDARALADALRRTADTWERRAVELEQRSAAPQAVPAPAPTDSAPPPPVPPVLAPLLEPAGVPAPSAEATDFYERTVEGASRTDRSAVFAPASVAVVTDEDIRSSGARTIPDLLRRVAGVDVLAMSASDQNVSIRGFNQRVSNRVLVLVDGRSVYQDFLGATFWTSLSINLDDIERIEVIRGPGAALYGANAVVGIINIVTRAPGEGAAASARATVGWPLLLDTSVRGSGKRGPVSLSASAGHVRQRKWTLELDRRRKDVVPAFGQIPYDLSADVSRADGTLVLEPVRWLRFTAHAGASRTTQEAFAIGALRNFYLDGYIGSASAQVDAGPARVRVFYNGARLRVGPQVRSITTPDTTTTLRSDVLDAEGTFTARFSALGEHTAVAGASWRYKSVSWDFLDGPQDEHHAGVFGEDTWVGPGGHRVVASGRVDRHPLVGVVPSARGAFVFRAGRSSALRAVLGTAFRNPTFLESYLLATPATSVAGVSVRSTGNRSLRPEQNILAEAGYSSEIGDAFAVDLAVYYGRLRGLIVQGPVLAGGGGQPYDPRTGTFIAGESRFLNDNEVFAQAGGEASLTASPYDGVDLYANYAYLRVLAEQAGTRYLQTPQHKLNAGARVITPVGVGFSADGHLVSRAVWAERSFGADGGVRTDPLEVPPYILVEARAWIRAPRDAFELYVQTDNMVGILPHDVAARLEPTPLRVISPFLGPVMAHREHPLGNPSGARVMAGISGRL